ncbi:Vacuolar protein sorting-associated protein 70 [Lachancea thermotolerans]
MEAHAESESQPLLHPTRTRENSVASLFARGRSNTINGLKTGYDTVKRHRIQFLYFTFASLLFYLTFTLAFLPRTSLSRDFRRLHFSKFTKAETYRIYLESLLRENQIERHLDAYTAERHLAGDQNALNYTVNELKALGFSPKIEKYYPWLNTPIDSGMSLWINGTLEFKSGMAEDALEEDSTSFSPFPTPAFHGYSANGNVTARFVYCNYGKNEDYEFLKNKGVHLEGMIHIIRYGVLFRGLKVKNAEKNGAAGVILYTDPYEDGQVTERNGFKSYPDGPARHASGFERGSVQFFTDFPGDPTTPGYASKSPETKRVSPGGKMPTIPSIPMSAKDISRILPYLNSRGCQFDVEGNIKGFEYYSGPSDEHTKLQVFNEQDYKVEEIFDVITEIPGILKGSSIIIGSHRDSWATGGAADPGSGSSILLEVARGLSKLLEKGWKPLRTIKLISWDGEEPAMLGSTEYGENHAVKLQKQSLAYLNLDTVITGSIFRCEANPLLSEVLKEAASLTPFHGNPDYSLLEEWKNRTGGKVDVLGAGTDFMVFQNHLGIPSANFKFLSNEINDPVYQHHTIYDSLTWMKRFGDHNYESHNTMAIFTGISVLMLSENELVTFKTHDYAQLIQENFKKWHALLNKAFPNDQYIASESLKLSSLISLIADNASVKFDDNVTSLRKKVSRDFPWWKIYKKIAIFLRLSVANNKLKKVDRLFVTDRGLKDRGWMRHSIFAPEKESGYVGDVMPGLHEAIVAGDPQEILEWLHILTNQMSLIRGLLEV